MVHALWQYCNTQLSYIHLSPSQILFHCQLRDAIPCPPQHKLHKNWIISAAQWEQANSKRDHAITEEYDTKPHALDQLEIGSNVAIYDPGKTSYKHWHKIGRIVEVLPNEQQGFANGGKGWGGVGIQNFAGGILLIGWQEPEEEWFWQFKPFSKLKTALCEYWTSITKNQNYHELYVKSMKLKQKWYRSNDYS